MNEQNPYSASEVAWTNQPERRRRFGWGSGVASVAVLGVASATAVWFAAPPPANGVVPGIPEQTVSVTPTASPQTPVTSPVPTVLPTVTLAPPTPTSDAGSATPTSDDADPSPSPDPSTPGKQRTSAAPGPTKQPTKAQPTSAPSAPTPTITTAAPKPTPPAPTPSQAPPAPVQDPTPTPKPPRDPEPSISSLSCQRRGNTVYASAVFDTGGLGGRVSWSIGDAEDSTPVDGKSSSDSTSATFADTDARTCKVTITTAGGSDSASKRGN